MNLFDGMHQRQLSPFGFSGGSSPLADSLCATLPGGGTPVAVAGDLAAVTGLAGNPWVDGRAARVRAYAGAALIVDGGTVGSLCVFDEQPHDFTTAQVDRLTDLAAVLVALLERRRQAAELAASTAFTAALLVRPGDTVARIGGDEFVLLCPGLNDGPAAAEVAERVTASFSVPLVLADGTPFDLGISVGAVLCDATDPPMTALARADAAMYRVKATRRSAVLAH